MGQNYVPKIYKRPPAVLLKVKRTLKNKIINEIVIQLRNHCKTFHVISAHRKHF